MLQDLLTLEVPTNTKCERTFKIITILPRYMLFILNTGFHRNTLGQSDSAPTGAPSIAWMPELVVDEPEPLPCPARPCWPTVADRLSEFIYMIFSSSKLSFR